MFSLQNCFSVNNYHPSMQNPADRTPHDKLPDESMPSEEGEEEITGVVVKEKGGGVALRTGPASGQVEWFDYSGENVPSVEAIAWGLGGIPRYLGHTKGALSVGQHSVACAEVARQLGYPKDWVRAALLHDAAEAVFGDVPGPLKAELPEDCAYMRRLGELEQRVGAHFNFKWPLRDSVKDLDKVAYAAERMCWAKNELAGVPTVPDRLTRPLNLFLDGPYRDLWEQEETYHRFLAMYSYCS